MQHVPRPTPSGYININTFIQAHRDGCFPRSLCHNTPFTIRRDGVRFRVLTRIPRHIAMEVPFSVFLQIKPVTASFQIPSTQYCFYNPTLALLHRVFSKQTRTLYDRTVDTATVLRAVQPRWRSSVPHSEHHTQQPCGPPSLIINW